MPDQVTDDGAGEGGPGRAREVTAGRGRSDLLSCLPCVPIRRRGVTLERAIFDAVLAQLTQVGYAGLTMEGVAACAHTGKSALYRRWPSKEDLVVDALEHTLPAMDDVPDHGDVREDILALLRLMAATVNSPSGCAIQSLMGEATRDHELVQAVHARVIEPRKRMMTDVLKRGVERGQVRPGAVSKLVAEVGPAMLIHHYLVTGPPITDELLTSIVDDVVMPLLRPVAAG